MLKNAYLGAKIGFDTAANERACNISFSLVSYWSTLTPLETCDFQVFLFPSFHPPCIRILVAPPSAFLFVPTPSLYPFGGNLRYLQTLKTMRHSLRFASLPRHSLRFASANELSKVCPLSVYRSPGLQTRYCRRGIAISVLAERSARRQRKERSLAKETATTSKLQASTTRCSCRSLRRRRTFRA